MELTSAEVRNATFTGTRHVYDRSEIDAFLERLAETLETYERDLATARRRMDSLEHALATARSSDETPRTQTHTDLGPAPVDQASWMSVDMSVDEQGEAMAVALEDARLLLQVAEARAADREEQHAVDLATETVEHRAMIEAGREAAEREKDQILAAAAEESGRLLEDATRQATEIRARAERDIRATERRIRQIRSALRDLELRFERASSNVAAEFSMLGDLIDLETTSVVDLTDTDSGAGRHDSEGEGSATAGFYEKRLAGLRHRLEARDDDTDADRP